MKPVVEQARDEVRTHLGDVADEAEVDGQTVGGHGARLCGEQVRVLPRDPDREGAVGVDQPDELALDLAREHHAHHLHDLRRCHAQPRPELADDPQPGQHRVDLRAAAVHHDGAQPGQAKEDDVLGEGVLQR